MQECLFLFCQTYNPETLENEMLQVTDLPTRYVVSRLTLRFVEVNILCARVGSLAIEICPEEGKKI